MSKRKGTHHKKKFCHYCGQFRICTKEHFVPNRWFSRLKPGESLGYNRLTFPACRHCDGIKAKQEETFLVQFLTRWDQYDNPAASEPVERFLRGLHRPESRRYVDNLFTNLDTGEPRLKEALLEFRTTADCSGVVGIYSPPPLVWDAEKAVVYRHALGLLGSKRDLPSNPRLMFFRQEEINICASQELIIQINEGTWAGEGNSDGSWVFGCKIGAVVRGENNVGNWVALEYFGSIKYMVAVLERN